MDSFLSRINLKSVRFNDEVKVTFVPKYDECRMRDTSHIFEQLRASFKQSQEVKNRWDDESSEVGEANDVTSGDQRLTQS